MLSVYEFLRDAKKNEPTWLAEKIKAGDPAALVGPGYWALAALPVSTPMAISRRATPRGMPHCKGKRRIYSSYP